jgi:hypothetical protein
VAKRPVGEIIEEVKRTYDRKPYDWRVLTGRDQKGYTDIFLSQSSTLWQIKTEAINPYELVGFGTRVGKIDEEIRRKTMEIGAQMLFEILSPQKKGIIITKGLQTVSSESTKGLKGALSQKQAKLDMELRRELEDLLHKRYPQTSIYV